MALSSLMGIVRKPEVSGYWSTNRLLKGCVMPRNCFQSILQSLHFADNSKYNTNEPNCDRLYKVRPLVQYLISKFKRVYIPEEHISIDEELRLWKGKRLFKQYIPLKMFCVCETTGYLWNSYVYLGNEPDAIATYMEMVRRLGKSGTEIPRLMEAPLGIGTLARNVFPSL